MQGCVLLEVYFEHGRRHRDPRDGPAHLERDASTGKVLRQQYYREGLLHRDESDGPATASFSPCPHKPYPHNEEYYCNGEQHRLAGPVGFIRCPETGAVLDEWYCRYGRLHRDDGPAIVSRHPDGAITYEAWYQDGSLVTERSDRRGGPGHDPDTAAHQQAASDDLLENAN